MRSRLDALWGRLRRPEYTGENRCLPCTAVNTVIAAVLAAVVWILSSPLAAVAVLVVALGAIAVRGYLVPGTPTLTKRHLPDRVHRWFGHGPPPVPTTGDGGVDVEAVLLEAGAVEECDDGEDLCLTDSFDRAWRADVERLRDVEDVRTALAEVLDADVDGLTVETHDDDDDAFVVTGDGELVGQWESRAACVADVAAARSLRERVPGWVGLDAVQRGTVLNGVRLFLEWCPACDGPVTLGQETVESCCWSREVVALTCDDCGTRLFEAAQG